MSELCSECGIVTRGGACSEIDSRKKRLEEIARCPNAPDYAKQYAREEYTRRYLGWEG